MPDEHYTEEYLNLDYSLRPHRHLLCLQPELSCNRSCLRATSSYGSIQCHKLISGANPPRHSIRPRRTDTWKLLLAEFGADANANAKNNNEWTPLHRAAQPPQKKKKKLCCLILGIRPHRKQRSPRPDSWTRKLDVTTKFPTGPSLNHNQIRQKVTPSVMNKNRA